MRARYYNPDLKRFMNRDVVSGNIIESQTLNRYAFVNGNPISYHDPFGLAREAIANANMSLMDRFHIGLDIAGMLPVIGEVADGLNAVLYLSKGDYTNALLSGMAMIPVVGNASTFAKYADDVAFFGKKGYNEIKGLSQPIIHNKPVAGDNVGVNLRGGRTSNKKPSKTPAERAADKGYPGIGTTINGGPDFSGTDYLYKPNAGEKNIVTIKMTGARGKDFTQGFNEANIPRNMRKSIRKNYTWHHVDDFNPVTGETTMQLVQRLAHEATYPHRGSVSQYEKFHNVKYKK